MIWSIPPTPRVYMGPDGACPIRIFKKRGEVFRPFLKRSLTKTQTKDCAVKWCVFTAESMGYFRTEIAVIKR